MSSEKEVQAVSMANETSKSEEGEGKILSESQLENGAIEKESSSELSPGHRQYLLMRHGTVDLIPLPSSSPHDPLNWPTWKKNMNLVLVAFHAMMTTFQAAGIVPAYSLLSKALGVGITRTSYLTSTQIVVLGFSPLFWKPLSNRYGRRPIWLLSTLGSCICNIGCANSHSYGALIACQFLVAFWISPAIAISSGVVVEMFFSKERGQKMGLWLLMVTLGPPVGPFIMGFVAYHTNGFMWIFYIYAIINAVQFILYFFLSPETLYDRSQTASSEFKPTSDSNSLAVNFRPLTSKPLRISDFLGPLKLFAYPTVIIPTIAYSMTFGFASVMLTVEIPQLFLPKFHFNPQQLGLQFLGLIIGSILGEQLSGYGSDMWMRRAKKRGNVEPEHRIWLAYIGFVTVVAGLTVFLVQTDKAAELHWNVTPIVGIAIAGFGSQIVGTVVTTYVVDCHPSQASSIGVFINVVRSTWGFIGPFWFPDMFNNLGLRKTAGLVSALVIIFGMGNMIFTQTFARKLRASLGDRA